MGLVAVDGQPVSRATFALQPGQQVSLRPDRSVTFRAEKTYRGLKIVFEDEALIVIEKDAGLLSIATGKEQRLTAYRILSDHLKQTDPRARLFVVHRLDRETSGLMVFAKSEAAKHILQETWVPRTRERSYVAVAEGPLQPPQGTIEGYLVETKAMMVYPTRDASRGRHAVTHYETLRENADYALLKVNLETGRKHQIRVHLQSIGHPIAGDLKYGAATNPLRRLALHAWVLGFDHPVSGERMRFETPLPGAFLRLFGR